jgi:hypothetical protein
VGNADQCDIDRLQLWDRTVVFAMCSKKLITDYPFILLNFPNAGFQKLPSTCVAAVFIYPGNICYGTKWNR